MSMNVQPDLGFIKDMKSAGGDTLKKCFQCATCSVVCPLSSDGNPFPRREMIMAQWGMKEQLLGDANVMLCHQCGDCTVHCPRGAKPGDVLGAIRAYAYKHFGWPSGLAKLASSGNNLPILIGMPMAIIFVLWYISGGMHFPNVEDFARNGYGHFFGHWDFHWLSKNVFFIDLFMLPAAGIAVYSTYRGVSAMWQKMAETAGVGEALFRPSIPQFVQEFLWPSILETWEHKRFKECNANEGRTKGHKPLLYSFVALFIVTVYSAFTQDVLSLLPGINLHGPISMWNPIKILANAGAIALIVGTGILWSNRTQMELDGQASKTFYDWFLIWEIMAVGVTGLGAELFRLIGVVPLGYVIYFLHLVSVMMLFLYMPYTKFAHIAYRTFAMAFERYRESAYVKNPLHD